MHTRQLKKEIFDRLSASGIHECLAFIKPFPARQVVNPLFSFLYHTEPMIKWHAVSVMGHVVASLADRNMESARVVIRRMIWNLNDESGGIGWGSPEAMGESMAGHDRLASEYHRILVSYIRPDGNFLEHPELQKGLLWGLARLAAVHPERVQDAGPFLLPFLASEDPEHRGLAAFAAESIPDQTLFKALENLLIDHTDVTLYWNMGFRQISVGELAKNALKRYSNHF